MKILITGHDGFIGRNMLAWCHQEEGWTVDGWEWDPHNLPDVTPYDWVIHLGAIADMTETDVDLVMNSASGCSTNATNTEHTSNMRAQAQSTETPETLVNMLLVIHRLLMLGASIYLIVGCFNKGLL
jgi:nucleoside-diphosphate-sugar epimerase